MTEKQKRRLLKKIRHQELERSEIVKFCTGDTEFKCDCEIDSLCSEKMISMTSNPVLKNGVFKSTPNDSFKIGDLGSDYLANIRKDYVRTYLPIGISILSLVVAIIALIVSIIAS